MGLSMLTQSGKSIVMLFCGSLDCPNRELSLSCSSALKNNRLEIVVVKIVDDVLITSERNKANSFLSSVKSQYKLGTIAFRPSSSLFNGLKIIQDTDFTIRIQSECKLESLSYFPIDHRRRIQVS